MPSPLRDNAGLTGPQRAKLKKNLEREQAAAREALKSREEVARSAESEIEPMDAAELTREQSDGALLVGRTRARLNEIEDALAKLNQGRYGLSERSGEPIGYDRLAAIPWARLAADEEEARPSLVNRSPSTPREPRLRDMPSKSTVDKAKKDLARGMRPSSAAGEFVREEMDHIRQGKHGARSTRQAIAIGLSKARRAGVPLAPPKPGKVSERTRRSAARDYATGQGRRKPRAPSARRGRAVERALKREGRGAASHEALAEQARRAASRRTAGERSSAAKKAVATKGPRERSAAAKKAAATRARTRG